MSRTSMSSKISSSRSEAERTFIRKMSKSTIEFTETFILLKLIVFKVNVEMIKLILAATFTGHKKIAKQRQEKLLNMLDNSVAFVESVK